MKPATIAKTGSARASYRALIARRIVVIAGLSAALLLSFIVDLSRGASDYTLLEVWHGLVSPSSTETKLRVILWDIRMPMALMAVLVGAALSTAGAEMQTVLNNPLASPFTLGISAAAGFGAAMALVLNISVVPWISEFVVPANAFVMAKGASMLIYYTSRLRGASVETIVLLGIALVFTFNAALALMQYMASEEALSAVVFWTMGSLTKANWPKMWITAAVLVICLPLFARRAWALTALRLGDARAAAFGISVERVRLEVILLVSLLAAVPVAFVGTIGFIGLVGPHIARMLIGEDQRFFLPAALLSGALIMSVASVASKSIQPGTIFPIGIITALIGVPFFITLILSKARDTW